METEYMTKKELRDKVKEQFKTAKLVDYKWLYNYFSEHEKWPVITDEVKVPVETGTPGEGTADMNHWPC